MSSRRTSRSASSLASSIAPEYTRGSENLSLMVGAYPSKAAVTLHKYKVGDEEYTRVVKPSTHLSRYSSDFEMFHKGQVCHAGQTNIRMK